MPAQVVIDLIKAYNAGAVAASVAASHRSGVTKHIRSRGVVKGLVNNERPEGPNQIHQQLDSDWAAWTKADDPFQPPAGATVYTPQVSFMGDEWATVHVELLYDGDPHIGTAVLRKRGQDWKISVAQLEKK